MARMRSDCGQYVENMVREFKVASHTQEPMLTSN